MVGATGGSLTATASRNSMNKAMQKGWKKVRMRDARSYNSEC